MISPFYKSHKTGLKIHVFKTNIKTKQDLYIIKQLLNTNPNIYTWSIDLEDIDKVLRIESYTDLSEKEIISMVKFKGFYCEELN